MWLIGFFLWSRIHTLPLCFDRKLSLIWDCSASNKREERVVIFDLVSVVQWARTVLIVERGIPPRERLRQQDLYSERMATKEKALVMKQTMSEDQLTEIKDIIEMKVTHRRNIKKRKEKFGYESNSLIGLDLAGAAANVLAPDVAEEEDITEPTNNSVAAAAMTKEDPGF